LVDILSHLTMPEGFRERVEEAVRNRVQNETALRRMGELAEIVTRIDFSWEQGFLSRDKYVGKRRQLQDEMASLRPIDYDEITEAADLLTHFNAYWNKSAQLPQPEIARQQLVVKIIDCIFVYDQRIIALVLHGDFGIVLGENEIASVEVTDAIYEKLNALGIATTACVHYGDDGLGALSNYVILFPKPTYSQQLRVLIKQAA
jgi:hypothetical protein